MDYRVFNDKIILRLDRGDEIVSSINSVLVKENIKCASISGIGATNDLTIGIFDVRKKEYEKYNIKDDFEIVSLIGNVSEKDDLPYVHLHIVCASKHGKTISGHLLKAKISLTCEIFIDVVNGSIKRKFDDDLNINKINF